MMILPLAVRHGVVGAMVAIASLALSVPAVAADAIDSSVPPAVVTSLAPKGAAYAATAELLAGELGRSTLSFGEPRRYVLVDAEKVAAPAKKWITGPLTSEDIRTDDAAALYMAAVLSNGSPLTVVTLQSDGTLANVGGWDSATAGVVATSSGVAYFAGAGPLGLFAVTTQGGVRAVDAMATASVSALRSAGTVSATTLSTTDLRTAVHDRYARDMSSQPARNASNDLVGGAGGPGEAGRQTMIVLLIVGLVLVGTAGIGFVVTRRRPD